ncbi:hypothetical protein THRCLA_01009 [Thraustotheca clavata]|uniref:Uncharacterized protein n=1 Tax=Thraustotheca clavata TaxID=74557 RepID=A0A1W0A9Q8_9STRA|nr:hypothetical protein THRCLA_01009 [Thraustotheca clavata]
MADPLLYLILIISKDGVYASFSLLRDTLWEDCRAMDIAAECGNLDAIKLLHRTSEGCSGNAMTYAAANGYLNMVNSAAGNGEAAIVSYLLTIPIGDHVQDDRISLRSKNGYINFYLFKDDNFFKFLPTGGNPVDRAAENGHNDVIQRLPNYNGTTEVSVLK